MSTLANNDLGKIVNKKARDPFDRLIFEGGLRAKSILLIDKNLDNLVVLLNNGILLKVALSNYPKLAGSTQAELDKWELIADGIGFRWDDLDEDLSIKGLIKESALTEALNQLQSKTKPKLSIL